METNAQNPWFKRIGLGVLALVGLLCVATVSIVVWIGSGSGRAFVEAKVEGLNVAGQTVEIDGLDGSVLGQFHIDRIELVGRDGVWLVAQDVSVDWSPRGLLSKTLSVEVLRISDLDIRQRPIFVRSGSGGASPVESFDIDGIDLPDVSVDETLFGQAIQLSANGNFRHGTDGGDGVMSARSDQGDLVEADLTWSRDLVLQGDADVDGAPGGLIAGLLRLDSGQRFTADVMTQDMQTQVAAKVDEADVADFLIERSQSQVSVSGTVHPDRLSVLNSVSDYLGGATDVIATLPLDQDALATISLRSAYVSLEAAGAQRDGVIVLDTVALEARDPLSSIESETASIGTIRANGRATIGEHYTFDGQLDASEILYQDYKVDQLSGPTSLSFTDGVLSFETAMDGQAATTLAAQADGARIHATGQVDLDTREISLSRADIVLQGLGFQGRGTIGYGEDRLANFNGEYKIDTKLFRDQPHAQLSGQATVRTTGAGVVADITGQARRINGLPDVADPLVTEAVSYTARVQVRDGAVIIPRFTAKSSLFAANGNARWSNKTINADINYDVPQYEYGAVSGADIAGQATLSGPTSRLVFQTDATASRLSTGGVDMSSVGVTADGIYADGVIETDATLSGETDQGLVEGSGQIVLNSGQWSVDGFEGSFGELKAVGILSGEGGNVSALRGDITVSGTTPLVPADRIDAKILLADMRVDVDATLSGVNVWQLNNAEVQVLAKGPREAVSFDVSVAGQTLIQNLERPLDLKATGTADLRSESLATTGTFDLGLGDLTLTGSASAVRAEAGWGGTLDVSGLGGTIEADFDPTDRKRLSYKIDSLTVASVAQLFARPVMEGSISGEGQFDILADRIDGSATLNLNGLRSPISDAEAISINSQIDLVNNQLTATVQAADGGLDGQARVVGVVETRPVAPFIVYPPQEPLRGTADLRGEIGPIVELFLPPRTDVAGHVVSTLEFSIPSTPTSTRGQVNLTDGTLEQGAIGLRLQNIAMVADLSEETIIVSNLSAEGVDGGTLRGSGRMGLGEGKGTVDIQAEKLRVVDRREGHAEVSGALNVSRTSELFRIAGELQVTDADLNVSNLPKPGLPTLEIDFGDEEEGDAINSFASSVTELDVTVVSYGRIKVSGRGLNASMSLDAHLQGSIDNPFVTGKMSIARGRFDFLSKRFEFRDSSVTLRDDILKSVLSLEAVRETPDLTAVVSITGTLERPEIELTSEPTLPEDEVLSRILFGRSPTQLSTIEAARLAAALTQLSGGSGFDLFGSLENAIGLDTLEIGQSTEGQTQLTTGKYLTDDVYLELRTAAEGTPGIAVEWQVRKNISVEAETLASEQQRLSIQWKKDFD